MRGGRWGGRWGGWPRVYAGAGEEGGEGGVGEEVVEYGGDVGVVGVEEEVEG